jgi:hypothetical protein
MAFSGTGRFVAGDVQDRDEPPGDEGEDLAE